MNNQSNDNQPQTSKIFLINLLIAIQRVNRFLNETIVLFSRKLHHKLFFYNHKKFLILWFI